MSWTYDHWKTTEPVPFEDEFEDLEDEPDFDEDECDCGEDTCVCPAPTNR